MKHYLLLTVFFLSIISSFSQDVKRVVVNGKIIAKNDVEGVTIYNSSSNNGTVADVNGDFKIEVTLNDVIEVSALQYVAVEVIITQDVIDSKILRLFLVEELNKLTEVILLPSLLTGEIHLDIDKTEPQRYIEMHFGDLRDMEFAQDQYSEVRNIITSEGRYYNGVDFARIIQLNKLFQKKEKPTRNDLDKKYSDELSKKYSHAFISGNFNIPQNRVNEFIAYVNTKNFDSKLLKDGNEMNLIEYLNIQSKEFLSKENGKN